LLNDNRITGAKNVLLLIVSGKEEITIDEIGLINDYIQERAGHGANIIMGVGEDDLLESSISVTVIATGFDPNQQEEILHTDPKKIIHSLDDNNEIVQKFNDDNDLEDKTPLQFDFSSHSIDFKNTDISLDSTNKINIDNQVVESEMMSKNEINKMEVSFEEISFDMDTNEEEEINDMSFNVNESELVEPADQVALDFDMPVVKHNVYSDKIVHELIEDVNDIIVNDPVHIIPVNEVNGSDIKKSGIDDYVKLKDQSKSFETNENKRVFNPINSSIAEGLAKRTEARKIKLKEYNYNFSKAKRISEMENEPAFKRAGVDLDEFESTKASRTSVSEDSNGEINLRTNNSFLHDNVD
jgi:cell division protein FtsZ